MRPLIDGILALPFTLLPRRYWQSFDFPVANMAPASGFIMFFAGFIIGIPGYFAFLDRMRGVQGLSILEISKQQLEGQLPETVAVSGAPSAIYAIAPLAFVLTPLGMVAGYLVLSSLIRIASSYVDDALGDPILTGLDALGRRLFTSRQQQSARTARERLEGAAEADRRYDGEWAGLSGVDFVIVASRRKPDWTRGTFVITPEGWFTLGEPFDRPTPNGIRTVYPLTLQTTPDVVRKSVDYQLPPLRQSQRRPGAQ